MPCRLQLQSLRKGPMLRVLTQLAMLLCAVMDLDSTDLHFCLTIIKSRPLTGLMAACLCEGAASLHRMVYMGSR